MESRSRSISHQSIENIFWGQELFNLISHEFLLFETKPLFPQSRLIYVHNSFPNILFSSFCIICSWFITVFKNTLPYFLLASLNYKRQFQKVGSMILKFGRNGFELKFCNSRKCKKQDNWPKMVSLTLSPTSPNWI